MDELITKSEAAKLLGMSEKTFTRRVNEGIFRQIKMSERIFKYSRAEVEAYRTRRTEGKQPDITPVEAEKVVRDVLERHQFDNGTTAALKLVAEYLASLYPHKDEE
jgi:predicted DNA-binding transcriptional regulator AlpA